MTRGADPRNRLVFSFVDTVAKLRPEWVVMENVAGFASLDDGSFVEKVAQELRDVGYVNVEHRILDAADYGVPPASQAIPDDWEPFGLCYSLAEEEVFREPEGLAEAVSQCGRSYW